MSDPLMAKLGALIGRVVTLQVGGQDDAGRALSCKTAGELRDLSDADVRVVFAGFLGFFAAAVYSGSQEARPILDKMNAAARDGGSEYLRACVGAVLSDLNPEGIHA